MEYIQWIGNIFIIIGLWLIGNKRKEAFIFSIIGESLWIIYSIQIELYSLTFICFVFGALALRSWVKWGK